MNIGQTTLVVFLSRLLGSLLGFVATVYFARVLGASVLGQYSIILALVAWLSIAARFGVNSAITKRVSENDDPFAFLVAGALLFAGGGILLLVPIFLMSSRINDYVGTTAAPFVALLLLTTLFNSYVKSALKGQRLVHIAGLLNPLDTGLRSLIQIALVFAGFNIIGMVLGYAIGVILVSALGLVFLTLRFERPERRHFDDLFDFAKYAWLASIQNKTYSQADILILGAFVTANRVGIYSVAWSLAAFLALFSNAISRTIFPEISNLSANKEDDAVANLLSDALSYTGLIIIPGLVGGALLSDRLLRIYGQEFTDGSIVLPVLIAAVLAYAFQQYCTTALNGLDRPDLSFKVYGAFVPLNIFLNAILIQWYGMIGAGIATLLSTCFGFAIAYQMLSALITFRFPVSEVTRQGAAAAIMGIIVYLTRMALEATFVGSHNLTVIVVVVTTGAGSYFVVLLAISQEFRAIVARNLPRRLL